MVAHHLCKSCLVISLCSLLFYQCNACCISSTLLCLLQHTLSTLIFVPSDNLFGSISSFFSFLLHGFAMDIYGRSRCAAAEGNEIAAKLILEKGGKTKGKKKELLTKEDKKGNIAIHYAANGGHHACVQLFLETAYFTAPGQYSTPLFSVDVCNKRGESPLLLAVSGSNVKLVECLLDNKGGGANIEGGGSETTPCFVTPLMRACECGQIKIALLLLHRGAEKEARDSKGLTPLHYAAAGRLSHHDIIVSS